MSDLDAIRARHDRETPRHLSTYPEGSPEWQWLRAAMDLRDLLAEVDRLHSWAGLMELLDEHYPEDVFPTLPDDESRDSGPRIVSLIRALDEAAKQWRADQ